MGFAMISRHTAAQIAYTYDEIAAAKTLRDDLEKSRKDRREPDFRDAFGRERGLQLGVPNGQGGHRLFDVSAPLAIIVIEAHIAAKNNELAALCQLARQELDEKIPGDREKETDK